MLEESSLCAGEDFVGGVELLLVEAFVKLGDERFEVGHGGWFRAGVRQNEGEMSVSNPEDRRSSESMSRFLVLFSKSLLRWM